MKIRVMSWNLWTGKNYEKISRLVKEKKIDIAGFQELDRNMKRTGYENIPRKIAESLGQDYYFHPSIKFGDGGKYGNCIISRFPIVSKKAYFLSTKKDWRGKLDINEPRTVLVTKIKVGRKEINFLTTHLGVEHRFIRTKIRAKQEKNLLKIIKELKGLIILTGDFNSLPEREVIKEMKSYLLDVDPKNKLKTWPTQDVKVREWTLKKGLRHKIDYIFISKDMKHSKPKIINTKISDHAPVIVDVEI